MKKITLYCDVCGNEFPPQEYSFLNGQLIKMTSEMKKEVVAFEGHYCGECTKLILGEITKIKNAKDTNTK